MAALELTLGLLGPTNVVVDGQDLTAVVDGVSITSQQGLPNRVRLALRADVELSNLSLGAAVDVAPHDTQSVVEWLANIDADELERAVLERLGWGDDKPMAMALTVLREMASGL